MSGLLTSIDARLGRWIDRVEASCAVGEPSLSRFRLFVGLYLLLVHAPSSHWIGHAPQGLYDPPLLSLARLFDGFPPPLFFQLADVVLLLALGAVAAGVRARAALLVFVGVSVVVNSFQYSFGKIDHLFLLTFSLACLAFTNAGSQYALAPDRRVSDGTQRTALGLAGLAVAFGMFSAGHEKLFRWVDFDLSTGGFVAWFYKGYLTMGRTELAAPLVPHVPPALFEGFDYFAVLFELAALVALLASRRAWHVWLLTACVFHLANTFLLNIPFLANVPVYLLYLAGARSSPAPGTISAMRLPPWAFLTAGALVLVHLAQRFNGSPSTFLFLGNTQENRTLYLWIAAAIWMGVISFAGWALCSRSPKVADPGLSTRATSAAAGRT